jgi:hypothetical protein
LQLAFLLTLRSEGFMNYPRGKYAASNIEGTEMSDDKADSSVASRAMLMSFCRLLLSFSSSSSYLSHILLERVPLFLPHAVHDLFLFYDRLAV